MHPFSISPFQGWAGRIQPIRIGVAGLRMRAMAEILEISSGFGIFIWWPFGDVKGLQDHQNNRLHTDPGNHLQGSPFSSDLSEVMADDDVRGKAMPYLFQHPERLFIIFNPFVQVVDFPDGIIVTDHIDEDLIHPGFLQFLCRFLSDETGMADHLEFRRSFP